MVGMMYFRKAVKEEKAEILALYRSLIGTECCAWSEEYPGDREIEGDFSRDALFCLRNEDGELLGVISIDDDPAVEALTCWSQKLQPGAELARLGVSPGWQNRGIARELLQQGMEELRRRGMKSVHFLVCKTNEKAIRSYAKLDFNIVGDCELFGKSWWCYEKEV